MPVGNVGDVSSDLSGRRGQMVGMDSAGGGMTTVEAKAPLAEVMTYARTLSSMTGGQGSYTMEFTHYDVVPGNVQQQIICEGEGEGRGRVTTAAEVAEIGATESSSAGRRPRNPWIAAALAIFCDTTGLVYCGRLRRAVLWAIWRTLRIDR